METQRDSCSLGRWSPLLLLLGLVIPLATTQTLSYKEAVLRAVDGLNQRSSDENLYRLLELDPLPKGDEAPDTPKPVSFTVKETVCPRTTQQPLEQCDFKENGLVKQCVGTVILDPVKASVDIGCDEVSGSFWIATAGGEAIFGTFYGPITHCPIRAEKAPPTLGSSLHLSPRSQDWLCNSLEQQFSKCGPHLGAIRNETSQAPPHLLSQLWSGAPQFVL
ncbi:protegrin-2-like [Equus caballus]|uniref:protegrin-2-like n=1 Tax=Equus caballus TaxID=9796 RepID=UPI0038B3987B